MKRTLLLCAVLLVACSAPAPEVVKETVIVEATVLVDATTLVQVTQPPLPTYTPPDPLPTYTPYPTYTPPLEPTETPPPAPTNTPKPDATATSAPAQAAAVIKRELDLEQDQGGVVIRVVGIAFTPVDAIPEFKDAAQSFEAWKDAKWVGMLSVETENTTDKIVNVHPAQATVLCGNEQADTSLWLSEDVGGEMHGGIFMEGVVTFPLARVDPTTLAEIRYLIDGPHDNNYDDMGDGDYEFVIPLQ